jgi:type IV secretion system protein VirD4
MGTGAKIAAAVVALTLALCAGLYLADWLTLLLLGLRDQVDLNWNTAWQYWRALEQSQLAPYALRIKAGGIAGLGLPLLLWLGVMYGLWRSPAPLLHGQTRFAGRAELAQKGLFKPGPYAILVGRWGKKLIGLPGQLFVILAAPTRSGKGVGVVIPNLLSYQGSVAVLDIKQENFNLTSGWRKSQDQAIYLFNPFAQDRRTHRWNPLSYVSRDWAFRISDIQSIAAMLYPDGSAQDRFWIGQARNAFCAFALYLFEKIDAHQRHRRSKSTATQKIPTLGQIYRISTSTEQDVKLYIDSLSKKPFLSEAAHITFANLLCQSEKTFSSILGYFQAPLHAWANPVLDAATSADDFDLRAVRKQKISIYIGIQPDKLAESRLIVNLFLSQLINVNTCELPERNPELKYPCLLLMDEFTAIGKVQIIASALSYMAGYNIRLLPIIQSRSQLNTVYGKDMARAIFTNHALQIIFTPREQKDANEYSEMLGYTTVRNQNITRGRETSKTETQEKRALMLPQELKAMPQDTEIFMCEGFANPVKCGKIKYYEDKRFTKKLLPKVEIPQLEIDLSRTGVQ